MAPSLPAAVERAQRQKLHQEAQEESADLVEPAEHAGDGRSLELEGDLRRTDGVDHELEDFGGPGTNW
jgi:hypothetical protein